MGTPSLSALLEGLPLPTLAIDADERVVAANTRATQLLGQGATGRPFVTVLRQPAVVEGVEQCMADHAARNVTYLAPNDAQHDVHVHHVQDLVIVSFQDVSKLTEAGQMRRDFVANVSHELRTPLTSLMGFIDTLQGPARDDPAARNRFLSIMSTEAERMNRLVGDLLSLSRVEADERVRPTTTVDLAAIVATTLRNIRPLADEADVELLNTLGPEPLLMLGDADQLQQVLSNLIENAIKYAASGKRVEVSAELRAHERALRGPALCLTLTDFGPGIAERHLPRLTERFYRADSHRSRALGGTGLGLAIVKHILNRHRGRLKIASVEGQGTTVTVLLPPLSEKDR